MPVIFESEAMTRSSKLTQMYIALPTGLLGGYLLINGVNAAFDDKLFLRGFLPFGLVLFVIGIVAIILVWYRSKGVLRVTRCEDNSLQLEIEFPSGIEELAKGSWDSEGIYTKEYEKLGMYKKHLALNLSCNQQAFCLLRQDLAAIAPEPSHFRLVDDLYNRGGTEYWCKKLEELDALIQKENSFKS